MVGGFGGDWGGARRTCGSARAAGARAPCPQPLRFPPPRVSPPGAPLQPPAPSTSYFCLFLRKKNNIIKIVSLKKKRKKKWDKPPPSPLAGSPLPTLSPLTLS